MAQFKIKCSRCKINYVVTTAKNAYNVACFDCNKKDMGAEITDPEMKKMFDIPEDFYKQNAFLRSIKINYLKYGKLSEKQLEIFKKVVNDMQQTSKKVAKTSEPETPAVVEKTIVVGKKPVKKAKKAKK